ncbi:hypothetical protein D3C86_1625710 [compost metagenome]
MAMPVVACITSSRFCIDWSSMRWRVTTVTDCGVSRGDRFKRVALLVMGTTYVPDVSVGGDMPATMTGASVVVDTPTTRRRVNVPSPAWAGSRPLSASATRNAASTV